MEADDLRNRFTYHAPNAHKIKVHEDIRNQCYGLALNLNAMLPDGREKSLAITHLEDVMMWANAALARNGE